MTDKFCLWFLIQECWSGLLEWCIRNKSSLFLTAIAMTAGSKSLMSAMFQNVVRLISAMWYAVNRNEISEMYSRRSKKGIWVKSKLTEVCLCSLSWLLLTRIGWQAGLLSARHVLARSTWSGYLTHEFWSFSGSGTATPCISEIHLKLDAAWAFRVRFVCFEVDHCTRLCIWIPQDQVRLWKETRKQV